MDYKIILISAVIGFLIGFLTNKLALYMLFHPRKKFLGILGIIPKRKEKLANSIADNIHLVFPEEYKKVINIPFVGSLIDAKVKQSISSTIQKMSNEDLERLIKNIVKREFFFIELLGGIVGLLIGITQGILVQVI
jgi:uncharacterized membrane protein YheB (UPF0754 family)